MSGSTIAQAVSFVMAPILYRIYDKQDYGMLGLYMATTSVIGVFASLQYSNSILIAEDKDEWNSITLSRLLNILVSLGVLILTIISFFLFPNFLNAEKFGLYFFLIPLTVFLSGQNELFRIFANRKKEYKVIQVNTIILAVTVPLLSLILGLLYDGPLGLFISLILGQALAYFLMYFKILKKYRLNLTMKRRKRLYIFAKNNIGFPKFILPSYFLGRFARQLPTFFFNRYFGLEVVGVYGLAVRMMELPSQIVTNAISEVFRQKVSENINRKLSNKGLFKKTFIILFMMTILPIIIITFFGPDLFAWLFGEKWAVSGDYAQVLIWLYSIQLISSPLSYFFLANKKLKETFFIHCYLFSTTLIVFYFTIPILKMNLISVLIIYSINMALVQSYYLWKSFKMSKFNYNS